LPRGHPEQAHGAYLVLMRTLGQRTGELHKALALTTGNPAFDPEPIVAADLAAWNQRVHAEMETTLARLEHRRDVLPEPVRNTVNQLLERRSAIAERLAAIARESMQALKDTLPRRFSSWAGAAHPERLRVYRF